MPIGDPLYASIVPARIACPLCDTVIAFGGGIKYGSHRRYYDPLSSTLVCPNCRHSYQVGILLWDAPHGRRTAPADTKPTRRQLLAIRALAGGYYVQEGRRSADPVNAYIRGECACQAGAWRAECPIHGMRESLGPSPEPEPPSNDSED